MSVALPECINSDLYSQHPRISKINLYITCTEKDLINLILLFKSEFSKSALGKFVSVYLMVDL